MMGYDNPLQNEREGSPQPMTTTIDSDPLLAAAETAWLEYTKGTYSETDKVISMRGFRDGWRLRREQALKKLPQSYTGQTIYC